MGTLFAYSIAISAILIVMYALYRATVSHTTHFHFNRAVLLGIYLVTFSVIPVATLLQSHGNIAIGELSAAPITPTDIDIKPTEPIHHTPWLTYLLWIYIIGIIFMATRLLITAGGLAWLIVRNPRRKCGRYTLVLHNRPKLVPFSWCRWIVMRHDDYDETAHITIAHETAHLDERHWLDLLIAEATLIVTWYNPASWMLRDELQSIHEFSADQRVISSGINPQQYQLFLIKKTVGTRFQSLANSLNHSSLKKRITMMLSKKSRGKARMRALALVPAVALAVVLVNNPAVASVLGSIASTPTSVEAPAPVDKDTKKSAATDKKVMTATEAMPQYPGGDKELLNFIAANLRWPEGADKTKKGRVIVQFTITETGKAIDPKVLMNRIGEEFGAEACRVISLLDNFQPGMMDGKPVAVKYTLPITFAPSDSTND